jgi:hypothetical protein
MSVESYVIASLVEEGSPKMAFQAGITKDDFEIHDHEFEWIVHRAEKRRPITIRLFKQQFPRFDFLKSGERLVDLLEELKQERAYIEISSAIEETVTDLSSENAIEQAMRLRDILGGALKIHAPNAEAFVKSDWSGHARHMKELQTLSENGEVIGIPTGIPHFDHHFGGMQGETTYLFLGRPGDAKSMTLGKIAVEGAWNGYRWGLFSPEMTEHHHRCRMGTLWSAKREIQEALGLKNAFRNRALKDGRGYNYKTYTRYLDWLEKNVDGEVILFNRKYQRVKMSVSYIESRIEDYGLDGIIVDPIYKLQSPRRRLARWEELGEITDALTDISHAFNIPVVMSNQANRAYLGGRGQAPDKDSSFGSDTPVQEADCVVGVKHFSEERTLQVRCSKNRHGEPFKFSMKFLPNIGVMEDITPIHDSYLNGYDPEKVEELLEGMEREEEVKV